ncbi:MAG: tetratricopeptide repeat protein [Acidobacteriota bacterium]|nr:tetratricopeptide repeat protein [Acidobacteriota bacterium]
MHLANAARLIREGNLRKAETELRRAVDLVPDNPAYLARLGQVLGMQNRMEEAGRYYSRALKLAPDSTAIRRNLALTQWSRRLFAEAKANLEQVLAKVPDDELTRFLLGMILVNSGENARAVGLLESVPERVRGQGEAVAALARAQYGLGKKEQARATLESMALNRSLSPGDVYACATTAANAEDFATAEKLFLSIRSTYPDPAALSYQVALMQFRSDRIDRSRQTLLEAIETGQSSGPIHNLLGHCYAAQNQLPSAVASFEQAMELEPAQESHYLDAVQLLAEHQIWRVLIRIAEKGLARIPRSDRLFRMKGLAETAMLYSEDAVRSYRRALEINPDSAKANLGLAIAQRTAGSREDAAATFEKGIRKFPDHGAHYQEYGLMLLKAAETGDDGALKRAVDLLQKSVELDASLPVAHYQLGRLALERDRAGEALPHLETAARLNPDQSRVHYLLARAYRRLGRGEEARSHLKTFRRMKAAEESREEHGAGPEPTKTADELVHQDPQALAAVLSHHYKQGNGDKARRILAEASGKASVDPQTRLLFGRIAGEAEDYETAEELFTSIGSNHPEPLTVGYHLGLVQFRTGRFAECRQTLIEALSGGQGNSKIQNLLGHCYQGEEKVGEALAAFQKAISRNPGEESNYLDLVRLLADESLSSYWHDASRGPRLRWHLALQALDRGVEKLPASARLFETRGFVQAKLDYTREAIQSYARALELDPGSAKAHLGLGVAQRLAGNSREARETFERGIRHFRRNASFYQEYGLLLAKEGDSGDEAARSRSASLLRKALDLDASLVEPHYQLGQMALAQGNAEEAARHFESAVRLAPRESKLRYGLVRAYRRLGRQEQAREQAGKYRHLKAAEEAQGTPSD